MSVCVPLWQTLQHVTVCRHCQSHSVISTLPQRHANTFANASAPALAMNGFDGWNATSWIDSSNFLRCDVISWTHVLLSRFHRRIEQSWPAIIYCTHRNYSTNTAWTWTRHTTRLDTATSIMSQYVMFYGTDCISTVYTIILLPTVSLSYLMMSVFVDWGQNKLDLHSSLKYSPYNGFYNDRSMWSIRHTDRRTTMLAHHTTDSRHTVQLFFNSAFHPSSVSEWVATWQYSLLKNSEWLLEWRTLQGEGHRWVWLAADCRVQSLCVRAMGCR